MTGAGAVVVSDVSLPPAIPIRLLRAYPTMKYASNENTRSDIINVNAKFFAADSTVYLLLRY